MCPHPLRSSFCGVRTWSPEEGQGCFSQGRHGWVLLGAPLYTLSLGSGKRFICLITVEMEACFLS